MDVIIIIIIILTNILKYGNYLIRKQALPLL